MVVFVDSLTHLFSDTLFLSLLGSSHILTISQVVLAIGRRFQFLSPWTSSQSCMDVFTAVQLTFPRASHSRGQILSCHTHFSLSLQSHILSLLLSSTGHTDQSWFKVQRVTKGVTRISGDLGGFLEHLILVWRPWLQFPLWGSALSSPRDLIAQA